MVSVEKKIRSRKLRDGVRFVRWYEELCDEECEEVE